MRSRVVQIKSISDETRSDGEFVDIIHTNSGNLWEGCLSIPKVFNAIFTIQSKISILKYKYTRHNQNTISIPKVFKTQSLRFDSFSICSHLDMLTSTRQEGLIR